MCVWLCVFIIFFCSYSGDPLDQGYFPVGESLNIINAKCKILLATWVVGLSWVLAPKEVVARAHLGRQYPGENTIDAVVVEKVREVDHGRAEGLGVRSSHRTDLCFSMICRFFQVVFILRAQPHAQSLFLFPIVFGITSYPLSVNGRPIWIKHFPTLYLSYSQSSSQRKNQFVSLTLCFTTQQVDRQRESSYLSYS